MDAGAFFLLGLVPALLFGNRKSRSTVVSQKVTSPVRPGDLLRYGQSVMLDRGNAAHTRHSGIDIFVTRAGAPVFAIGAGVVIRRQIQECKPGKPCAGLFVDLKLDNGVIARYLHLGSANVKSGQQLRQGDPIGTVADTGQSGLGSAPPHLHFELRKSDWIKSDYGEPIDPRPILDNLSKGVAS